MHEMITEVLKRYKQNAYFIFINSSCIKTFCLLCYLGQCNLSNRVKGVVPLKRMNCVCKL